MLTHTTILNSENVACSNADAIYCGWNRWGKFHFVAIRFAAIVGRNPFED
jgi:hypothetical protein